MRQLRNVTALMLAVLMVVLAGCQGGGGNASTQAPQSTQAPSGSSAQTQAPASTEGGSQEQEPVTLSYTWWGNQVRAERTQAVIDMFIADHPYVTINPEFTYDYEELIKTRASAGAVPDVMQTDMYWIAEWAQKGLMIPLDPYVEEGIIDLTDCDAKTVDIGRYDGKLWALSMGNNARCMFYDATLLESLDLEISMEPTWDEFIEIGKTVYEKTGVQTCLCWQQVYAELMRNVIRGEGCEFFNEEQNALGFGYDEALKCYQLLYDMSKEDWTMDPAEYAAVSGVETQPVALGKAWNCFISSNMGVGLQAAIGEEHKVALCMYPVFADGQRQPCYVQASQLSCLGSSGTEASQRVAAEFLNYIVNDIDANKVLLMERGISMNTKVCEALANDLDPMTVEIADFMNYAAEHGSASPALDPGYCQQIYDLEADIRTEVLFGSKTPEAAAEEFVTEANKICAENAK